MERLTAQREAWKARAEAAEAQRDEHMRAGLLWQEAVTRAGQRVEAAEAQLFQARQSHGLTIGAWETASIRADAAEDRLARVRQAINVEASVLTVRDPAKCDTVTQFMIRLRPDAYERLLEAIAIGSPIGYSVPSESSMSSESESKERE